MTKTIIHISGASGSGKTFLGNLLKEQYKNRIIVQDLDDLRDKFIKNFYGNKKWSYINEREYQNYIDAFIDKQNKPIVFVGLNDNNVYGKNKRLYYNLQSQYNYYIEIDDMIIVKQKCLRLLDSIQNDEMAMKDLIQNNELFVKLFSQVVKKECSAKETIKMNNKWKKDYEKQDYKFMSSKDILKDINNVLSKII